jgi:diacylglycerol kinase family enzyme
LSVSLEVPVTVEANFNNLILILNAASHGGAIGRKWNDTYAKIKEFLPGKHRIIFTKKPGDGTNITRKLLRQGYSNIGVVGGEIANGFFNIKAKNSSALDTTQFNLEPKLSPINPKAALWIIPSGTRNVLAASLRIPHLGIESVKHIQHMKKRKIDVIGVTVTGKDNPSITHNRIVLNAAEMGLAGEIINRSKRVRGKIKSRLFSTVAGIVTTLPTYESKECDIILDGDRKITSNLTLAVVANGNFLGGIKCSTKS